MKHLHRDNFRHLTGFGRTTVQYVEAMLDDWKFDRQSSLFEPGNLNLKHDIDRNEYSYEYIPHQRSSLDRMHVGGMQTTGFLNLNIIVKQGGLMEITGVPLFMVLSGAPDYSGTYQVYQHDIFDDDLNPLKGGIYIGITKRGWRTRWKEHLRSARSGSHYAFHRAIRQYYGVAKLMSHCVLGVGLSESAAMTAEEDLVGNYSLYPQGLNMIPGGNKGLAYLRQIGAISQSERVDPDNRQGTINRFFECASRKGLPNPLAAANWLNSEYAEKVICSGEDRLKPQQIRDARFLASLGRVANDIAVQVGARNVAQIQRLIAGETYSRVA